MKVTVATALLGVSKASADLSVHHCDTSGRLRLASYESHRKLSSEKRTGGYRWWISGLKATPEAEAERN